VKLGGLRHRANGSIVKLDLDTIAAGRAARTAKRDARGEDIAPIISEGVRRRIPPRGSVDLRKAGLSSGGGSSPADHARGGAAPEL
jgi:hypothetical protein